MCIALFQTDNGSFGRCRKCWQCKDRRVSDWVGRCTAEAKSAVHTDAMTLTYGPDEHGSSEHMRSQLLVYEDFQKFIRSIRDAGYPVRFFVVGEYGSEKGRTHWHCVLFWQEKPYPWPPEPYGDGRRWTKRWPHGHVNLDERPNRLKAVRYACKYIQKDETDRIKMGYSTKPALGANWFFQRAENMVREGLAPQDLVYRFGDHKVGRKLKKYYMHKGLGDRFIEHWIKTWRQCRKDRHMPFSPLIEDYLDRQAENQLFDEMWDGNVLNSEAKSEAYSERLARQREERYSDDLKAEKAEKEGRKYERDEYLNGRSPPDGSRGGTPRQHPISVGNNAAWARYTEDTLGIAELTRRRP